MMPADVMRTATGSLSRLAALWIFFAVAAPALAGSPAGNGPDESRRPAGEQGLPWLHPWGEPESDDTTLVFLRNSAYDCGYASSLTVARWAAYAYTRTAGAGDERYRGRFRADPRLDSASGPLPSDYQGLWTSDLNGYDRGHQAPDAAVKVFGPEAQQETYYLSNATPQHSRFNQGFWRELETMTREWAGDAETVWVVTGPVFFAAQETVWLGPRNRLARPHAYFQTVARRRPERAVALLVPHRRERMPRDSAPGFVVSVDSVERLTGLSLFPLLPDSSRKLCPGDWPGLTTD